MQLMGSFNRHNIEYQVLLLLVVWLPGVQAQYSLWSLLCSSAAWA